MTDWLGPDPADSTPLDEDELVGLIPSWIATRDDLNRAERDNILAAQIKWNGRRSTVAALLDDLVARRLHRDMFGRVWRWAGTYRSTERNIGIAPGKIAVATRDLMENAKYWFEPSITGDDTDAAACRFHHRLVQIHPFPNGNGRQARLHTDLILAASGRAPFTWGSSSIDDIGTTRRAYVEALRSADRGDPQPLTVFARS